MTFSAYFTRKSAVAALLGVGLLVAATLTHVLWQASRAVRDSADQVASESQLAFTTVRFDQASLGLGRTATMSSIDGRAGSQAIREPDSQPPSAHVAQRASAFEWLSAPAVFSDAAVFEGRLYLAGPSGLFEYGPQGDPQNHYRVGRELPAAPPAAIAAGLSTRTAGRSLYVATAGEGLLIFDRGASATARPAIEQVRADEAACRDLTAVLPLPSGRVLLGTKRRGVLVYDGKRLAPLHRALASFHVTALAGDESDLWIGTLDRGTLHWQAGQLDAFSEAEGLPDRQVLALAVADAHTYVGTPTGVAEFHNGRYQRTLASGFFANALLAQGRQLKVGTLDEGIVEIPLEASRTRAARPRGSLPAGPQNVRIERLFEVEGTAYALAEDGLYRLDRSSTDWQPWLGRDGALLTDRNISALAADSAGRLWIGYFDRGLDILSASGDHVTHIENQHVFCVNRIAHHHGRGLTAVATANGLVLFDAAGRQQQVLGRDDGLIANHVTDVAFGSGGMAVATPAGITFLDSQGPRSLYAFHGLVNNHVYALASAGDRLLAGTLGGLSVLDGDVVRASYTTANSGLKHNWITAIVPFGQEWFVGTYGSGVLQLDSVGQWHALPGGTGKFEVNPNAMVAGPNRIYAGALGLGLGVYDRGAGRWTWITAGLPSANVTALALHGGYLYVGTDNGLVRIAEHGLLSP